VSRCSAGFGKQIEYGIMGVLFKKGG